MITVRQTKSKGFPILDIFECGTFIGYIVYVKLYDEYRYYNNKTDEMTRDLSKEDVKEILDKLKENK